MKCVRINNQLTISDQPDLGTLASLGKEGFTDVINLRPDGEASTQPDHHAASHVAREAGLRYHYLPISLHSLTRADIRAFQHLLEHHKGPIFAHCASGKRVMSLYALAQVLEGHIRSDEVLSFGRNHGFDLQETAKWLENDRKHSLLVEGFFEPRTWSIQYIVIDSDTKHCAIIDPVLDYDEKSGTTATHSADRLLEYVQRHNLKIEWILDTHPHADHFSAAHYLKNKTGAPTGIGAHVTDVQKLWKTLYNLPSLPTDGSQWDRLFHDNDTFTIGSHTGRVLSSPGHTLASISYLIDDAVFVHDSMFMPDSGTARTDFPGGSAHVLWNSLLRILALPDETRVFTGHDYQPGGRHPKWESTIKEQKNHNPHLKDMTEERFVALREARDHTLPMPKLILHALQVNIRGGELPKPENNGRRYLKIPLNAINDATW